jgi:phytoene dehydrogenase-like protein
MNKFIGQYDAIIIGGGIAGLTAGAYLSKSGYRPLIIEQQEKIGGLISSFDYKGFVFDGGIRSIESSGVIKPMIRDLDLDVDFLKSKVTLGIENEVISLENKSNIEDFEKLLISLFPSDKKEIQTIIKKIYKMLNYMDILYKIDNPMIIDFKEHPTYLRKTFIPWLFKFLPTLFNIDRLTMPVDTYLRKMTQNQALIDMISQHFFKNTPTFFALGYFAIYFDYHYPKGGTGVLPKALENYILSHGGKILTQTKITSIDIQSKHVIDEKGDSYSYQNLIWAADMKQFYSLIDMKTILDKNIYRKISAKKSLLQGKKGAESVLTVYATVNLEFEYFKKYSSEHFFYTPRKKGLSNFTLPKVDTMESLTSDLKTFYDLNTYEISIPVLRDETLAPKGKTGLIISILIDYNIVHHIKQMGYYEAFKSFTENYFIDVLSQSIYPHLKEHVIETFCSTPLTFQEKTGNTDGAIIGWSYLNSKMPCEHKMSKITQSIQTKIPHVYQAGQWSFSPAGVPISVITGKLAADQVKKQLKKKK